MKREKDDNNQINDLYERSETILVNQGGGSLGAYELGICKVLAKHDIKFDIIAGTSIGGINAAILAAGYSQTDGIKNSVKILENFWMDLAEKSPMMPFCPDKQRSEFAAFCALFWGIPKAFMPLWIKYGGSPYYYFFNSPYLYESDRLKNLLNKYIDFTKLRRTKQQQSEESIGNSDKIEEDEKFNHSDKSVRLILTATNIQTGEPTTFDSNDRNITIDHVMASAGYAIYGLPWVKIDNNYFWDGAFIHNTPLDAIIKASPRYKKIAYISDVFPIKQEKLATNMPETYHRIRDLLFHDTSIQVAKEASDMAKRHISLINKMYELISKDGKNSKHKYKDTNRKLKLNEIEKEYNDLVLNNLGIVIDKLIHIERKESKGHHYLFEDADFSITTIKKLIQEGEKDTERILMGEK